MAKKQKKQAEMSYKYSFKAKLDIKPATGQKVDGGVIVGTPFGKFTTNPNGKKNVCCGVEENLTYPSQEEFEKLYDSSDEMKKIIDKVEA
jgi:hypothetical protein